MEFKYTFNTDIEKQYYFHALKYALLVSKKGGATQLLNYITDKKCTNVHIKANNNMFYNHKPFPTDNASHTHTATSRWSVELEAVLSLIEHHLEEVTVTVDATAINGKTGKMYNVQKEPENKNRIVIVSYDESQGGFVHDKVLQLSYGYMEASEKKEEERKETRGTVTISVHTSDINTWTKPVKDDSVAIVVENDTTSAAFDNIKINVPKYAEFHETVLGIEQEKPELEHLTEKMRTTRIVYDDFILQNKNIQEIVKSKRRQTDSFKAALNFYWYDQEPVLKAAFTDAYTDCLNKATDYKHILFPELGAEFGFPPQWSADRAYDAIKNFDRQTSLHVAFFIKDSEANNRSSAFTARFKCDKDQEPKAFQP